MKYLKIFALICAIMMLLCACNEAKPNESESTGKGTTSAPATTEEPTTEEITTAAPVNQLVEQLKSGDYSVVYPSVCSQTYADYAARIRSELVNLGQKIVKTKSDYVSENEDPDAVSEYEILLGATNRSVAKGEIESLGTLDYLITIKGNRIIIAGGSDYILKDAVDAFAAMLDADEVKLPLRQEDFSNRTVVRFGSYNLHGGSDVKYDYTVFAEDILKYGIEVVGLQEVDKNTSRNKWQDTVKIISDATGYKYAYFTRAIDHAGGEYGTGIVSKYPIESFSVHALPNEAKSDGTMCEARSFGHAVINVNGTKVNFINTHLTHESSNLIAKQYATIVQYVATNNLTNVVITADFNTANFDLLKKLPGSALAFDKDNAQGSFGSSNSQIDNVVYTTADFTCVGAQVVKDFVHSDHYMLWSDLLMGDEETAS